MVPGAGLVRRRAAGVPLIGSTRPHREHVRHGRFERRADSNPIAARDCVREDDPGLTGGTVNHAEWTSTSMRIDRRGLDGVSIVVQHRDLDVHAGQKVDGVPVDVSTAHETVHRRTARRPRRDACVVGLPCVSATPGRCRRCTSGRRSLQRREGHEAHPHQAQGETPASGRVRPLPSARPAPAYGPRAPQSIFGHRALLLQRSGSVAIRGPARRASTHVAHAGERSESGRPGMRNETPTSTCPMMRAWDQSETFNVPWSSRTTPPDTAGRATSSRSMATSPWRTSSSI